MTIQIPKEALDAAGAALADTCVADTMADPADIARIALEAAAPFMVAAALVDASNAIMKDRNVLQGLARVRVSQWLVRQALRVGARG